MTRYSGLCCGCVWEYVHGHLTPEDWDAHIATVKKVIDGEYAGADTFLSITYATNEVSSDQRRQLMEVIQSQNKDLRKIKGRALVVDSLVLRAAILTLAWIFLKSFDLRVFARPQPAFEWLATQSAQFDVEKVTSEIRKTVAREHLWDKV